MKILKDQKVVYLSSSDLLWDAQRKITDGKLKHSDVRISHFNSDSVREIRTSSVAVLTHGLERHVIKSKM
jgi:hypothetical protein